MQSATVRRGLVSAFALIAGPLLLLPVFAQRSVPAFRIASVKAMLFYGETGTFSTDLFGPSAPSLQNVATGPGQAIATMVVVEIAGPPDAYAPSRKVSFRATAGKRVLENKSLTIGRPGDDGKFQIAFWLYDTGCTPVVLNARITGQSEVSAVEKRLNFKCGD